MSSVGQAVGGGVGAIAGFFIAGPTGAKYGAQIGITLGGLLDPPKGPTVEGPRLDDLTVQTATYGAIIPRTYGSTVVVGNVFWLENNAIRQVRKKKKSGGKGGGAKSTTITYSYYATFAVGLCDCPSRPIVGVRKIWIAGRLFYDAGSTDQSAIRASNAASSLFTVHLGSDTQLPDDRMQATLGVNSTPAYRGLAYIVFKDLPLANYSNSLMGAQVKVEVISDGTTTAYTSEVSGAMTNAEWRDIAWNGLIFCAVSRNGNIATSPDGMTWTARTSPGARTWQHIIWTGKLFVIHNEDSYPNCYTAVSPDGINWTSSAALPSTQWTIEAIAYGKGIFTALGGAYCSYSYNGLDWIQAANHPGGSGNWVAIEYNGDKFVTADDDRSMTSSNGIDWTLHAGALSGGAGGFYSDIRWNGSVFLAIDSGISTLSFTSPDGIVWTSRTKPAYTTNAVAWTGEVFVIAPYIGGLDQFWVSADGISWTGYVPTPTMYGFGIAWNGAVLCVVGNNVPYACVISPRSLSAALPTLDNIVETEMLLSNILLAADVDTSLLTQPVRGFKISTVAAIRSGLEVLQGAWPFDIVQHGYTIQAKPRPSTSIVTITEDELDARSTGETPGVAITTQREMDTQIPRRVSVSYLDVDREYDVNEQYEERLNTDSVGVMRIEMAVSLSGAEAAQIAQRLLYLYWLERYVVSFSLPPSYNQLEPGDVVTLTASHGTYSLRLTSITYAADGRLECAAKYNDTAIYTAVALGVTGSAPVPVLGEIGPSLYALLDLPSTIANEDTPGMVVAMTGYRSGWLGGAIYRSLDSGATWDEIASVDYPGATMLLADSPINTARFDIVDSRYTLVAHVVQGDLFSVSELEMLNGDNYFAYGVPGRWEIIAAKNCVLQGSGDYWISDFLRGQYGTEWASGLHKINDFLVLLDPDLLEFVSYPNSYIAQTHDYRGVNAGELIDSADDYPQTYYGTSLVPLSPVYLSGVRHRLTGDQVLSWLRRTRISGAWLDSVDVPISEDNESYTIEIYSSNTYTTLKRTLTATTNSVTYTGAMQIADFGSIQNTVYAKVYQMSAVLGKGTALVASVVSNGTPGVFLAHMDDAGFTDVYGQSVTSASATLSSAQSKFGGYSAYNSGANTINYASTGAKFKLYPDDFCYELWINPDSFAANRVIFSCGNGATTYYEFEMGSTGKRPKFRCLVAGTPMASYEVTADLTMVAGTWYALAVERVGTTIAILFNGVPQAVTEFTAIGTNDLSDVTQYGLKLFAHSGSANPAFVGYIDELRLSKPKNQYRGLDYSAGLQTAAFVE